MTFLVIFLLSGNLFSCLNGNNSKSIALRIIYDSSARSWRRRLQNEKKKKKFGPPICGWSPHARAPRYKRQNFFLKLKIHTYNRCENSIPELKPCSFFWFLQKLDLTIHLRAKPTRAPVTDNKFLFFL